MPAYRYRAVTTEGRIRKGVIVAANENALAAALAETGHQLIAARARTGSSGTLRAAALKRFGDRITPTRRAAFAGQLADLLSGGMPLLPALHALAQSEPEGPFHDRLSALARSVAHGCTLSEAAARPPLFPPVGLAILAAGEHGDHILPALRRIQYHIDRAEQLKRKTIKALRYPLFLLLIASGVIAFMMGMVVPEVTALLASLGTDLPWSTRLLIALSNGVAHFGWAMPLITILAGCVAMAARRASRRLAILVDRLWLRIPGLGPVLRLMALARFTGSLSALMQGNLDTPGCLRAAANVLGNRALIAMAENAATRVQHGHRVSVALEGLMPSLAARTLGISEHSARIAPALDELSAQFEAEAGERIANMLGAMEPALTLLIGGLLAWVVLAVLGPVYGSLGVLSRGI